MNKKDKDFTRLTNGRCAICGRESENLRDVVVSHHNGYDNMKIGVCEDCLAFMDVDERDGVLHSETIASLPNVICAKLDGMIRSAVAADKHAASMLNNVCSLSSFPLYIDKELEYIDERFEKRMDVLVLLECGGKGKTGDFWHCPACGSVIKEISPDYEIDTKFEFRCDCGCCHFTEDELYEFARRQKIPTYNAYAKYETIIHNRLNSLLMMFFGDWVDDFSGIHSLNDVIHHHIDETKIVPLTTRIEDGGKRLTQDNRLVSPERRKAIVNENWDSTKKAILDSVKSRYPELKDGSDLSIQQIEEIFNRHYVRMTQCKFHNDTLKVGEHDKKDICSRTCQRCIMLNYRYGTNATKCKNFVELKDGEKKSEVKRWIDCKFAKVRVVTNGFGEKFLRMFCEGEGGCCDGRCFGHKTPSETFDGSCRYYEQSDVKPVIPKLYEEETRILDDIC